MLNNGAIDEIDVLTLLSQGLGTRAISAKLNCSRKTIRHFLDKKGIRCNSTNKPPKSNTAKTKPHIQDELKMFCSKIDRNNPNGCWEWKGSNDGDGYGRLKYNKQQIKTHRLFYMLFKGEIPENMLVCHMCDNKLCCNPDHLFLGTDKDNTVDCIIKGRHSNCKLSKDDIRAIRLLYMAGDSYKDLSFKYNVTEATISSIISGKSWGYIK